MEEQGGVEISDDLVSEVSMIISEWEQSDELVGEFSERLIHCLFEKFALNHRLEP